MIGSIAVLLGGFLQGSLGFGFGLISVPPLLMVLSASEVVPMQIALSLMLSIPLAFHVRRFFQASVVLPMLLGAVVGLPFGMKILTAFDGPYLKLAVGVILVAMSVTMLTGWSRPVKSQALALVPVGILSGIMQTAFSMSGPPIILFLTNQSVDKERFRANLLIYFALLGTVSTTGFAMQGAITDLMIQRMTIFVPGVLIGGYAGTKLSTRIPQENFRKITLAVVAIMGLILVARNLLALFSA